MKRVLVAMLVILAAVSTASAQDRDADAEAALARAVEAVKTGIYHFEYDVATQTGRATGSGYGDRTTNTWQYSVQNVPPAANDGDWIIKDSVFYLNGAPGGPDWTNSGITSAVAPFESYETLAAFDGFTPLTAHGTVDVDGQPAEHYSFAVKGNPLYGTTTFELFLTEGDSGIERVILVSTPEGREPNRVVYTRIGEAMDVQAP